MERLICGLTYGVGGRTKASHWKLLEGKFLIHQEKWGLFCNHLNYLTSSLKVVLQEPVMGFIMCWVRPVHLQDLINPKICLNGGEESVFLCPLQNELAWSNVSGLVKDLCSLPMCAFGKSMRTQGHGGEKQPEHLERLKEGSWMCSLCLSDPRSPNISSLHGL